ncbi:nucleotidyltransferase [Sutcliffiella sp. NC1]|uniref:nucleotidyltransferase n=1 Tax=Sutcliffiella sp. NC1 TaxID=3004096 RepID=UPI0022DE55D5|nr:nucleotidyltransferase [Sutcliffiella sp. NC1]WBL15227.1 nucleotidyltransferase [Sutcliffiella sp. NC1]
MYDLSSEFHSFYKKHVVLPKTEKTKLFEKKDLNLQRLKDGLGEYNKEKGTEYKIAESMVQGSVAMSTVIKNESNDYDIDVAIVFEKDKIPDGTIKVKNIVVNALTRKCTGFKVAPYAKTNCVRIEYSDGYHIDFAIYRRFKDEDGNYQYEHCGSKWRSRDPKSITAWFIKENKEKNYQLRELVRLMKMFSRSRKEWKMPGGLVQSVLVNEKFQSEYKRIDERFYYTLKEIKDRLNTDKDVNNPTDETQTLKLIKKDNEKINNLYNRLNTYLAKLEVLFKPDCTKEEALAVWKEFFNNDFWEQDMVQEQVSKSYAYLSENEDDQDYQDTEEFIEYLFPIDLNYSVELDCKVTQSGWRTFLLSEILRKKEMLQPKKKLEFFAKTDVPGTFDVYWKVKNKGIVAKKRNEVRGQIIKRTLYHTENTRFKGEHFVEVYIVKNGVCVARQKMNVPITTM